MERPQMSDERQHDKSDEGKLLPCPCCGGEAQFGEVDSGETDDNHGGHYIECSGCGLTTNLVFPDKGDVERELREVWNRRPVSATEPFAWSRAAYRGVGFSKSKEHADDVPLYLTVPSIAITDAMVERALDAADGAMVDTRRHWTPGDRAAVRAMLKAALERPFSEIVEAARQQAALRAAAPETASSAVWTPAIYYQRAPEYDRRIANGDDFSGDAFVRWVAVGHEPSDARKVEPAPPAEVGAPGDPK
jgi:hypothetical protein